MAPFKQPLAGAGVELSARPVTATAKAAGSNITFIRNSFRGVVAGSQQTPGTAGSRTERIALKRSEALNLSMEVNFPYVNVTKQHHGKMTSDMRFDYNS